MTKSRKLLVAAALLAGGYGVARFLGAPDLRGSHVGSPSHTAGNQSVFSSLRDLALGRQAAAPTGQLVPDNGLAARVPASPIALVPQPTSQQPTWLVATSPTRATLPPIEPPKLAEAAASTESRPIAPLEAVPAAPKARITNVVSSTVGTTDRAASQWDRWPWWDSNAVPTASVSGGQTGAGPAYEATRSTTTTASFDISAPARSGDAARIHPEPYHADDAPSVGDGRTHVVVDGDSLSKLADRYLDDAELGEEIYRLNQDVLKDPALLPIGVELRIPENRVANAPQRFAGTMGLQAANGGPPAGMVPVEWKPRPFDSEPRAQLLRPVPAGRSD